MTQALQMINEYENRISEKTEQIEACQTRSEMQTMAHRDTLKQRYGKIERLKDKVEERDDFIEHLKDRIEKRDEEIKHLQDRVGDLEKKLLDTDEKSSFELLRQQ